MGTAHFSGTSGRGIVYTDGGTYVLEVRKMYQPELAGNTNLAMWIQGPSDVQTMDTGEFPFVAVYDAMDKEHTAFIRGVLSELSADEVANRRRSDHGFGDWYDKIMAGAEK